MSTGSDSPNSGCAHLTGIGCGSLLAFFGAAVTGGAALSFGSSGNPVGDAIMTLLFGITPLVLGVVWAWRSVAARRRARWEEIERQILALAMQRGGTLTAMEVAAHTTLSFGEAKCYLDRLADQGHVEVIPSDEGLAYRFPGATRHPRPPIHDAHPPSARPPGETNRP